MKQKSNYFRFSSCLTPARILPCAQHFADDSILNTRLISSVDGPRIDLTHPYFCYRARDRSQGKLRRRCSPPDKAKVSGRLKLRTESMLCRRLSGHRPLGRQYIRTSIIPTTPLSTHRHSTSHAMAMPLLSGVRNDDSGMHGVNL